MKLHNHHHLPPPSMDTSVISDDQLARNLAKYSLLLNKLNTLSQVNKLSNLIKSDHYQHQNKNLKSFIQQTNLSHNKQIRKLELQRTDLTSSLSNYHNILSLLNNSNQSASKIHLDINNNHNEHSFLQTTHLFLQTIRVLKNNIILIDAAINDSNYIVAAKGINEIFQLPDNIKNSRFANHIIPTTERPYSVNELISIWTKQLRTIFTTNFNNAMINNDTANLTQFFQLFPLINEPTLGLDLYSKYITDMISQENQKFTLGSMKLDSRFDLILLQLFKIVSTIINEHSKIIAKAYGIKYMTVVMSKIEIEVELQCCLVWNYFNEKKNLVHWQDYNLIQLKNLITEFSLFLQNWSMYQRFFSVRWNDFAQANSHDNLTLASPIANGSFIRKLNDEHATKLFQKLNYHYLITSFKKSVQLEEIPSLNKFITLETLTHDNDLSSWPISSALEDLTLLLRQTLINNVNTGDFIIVNDLLFFLPKFIQNEFLIKFLQEKFKSLQNNLTTGNIIPLKKIHSKQRNINSQTTATTTTNNNNTERITKLSDLQNQSLTNSSSTTKFNIRGAFANIQSNLQSVVASDDNNNNNNNESNDYNMDSILALHHYLVYVNTLFLMNQILTKILINEIINENPNLLIDNFPFNNESTQIKNLLYNCQEKIVSQLQKLQSWSIKYLCQTICLPKIKILLNDLFINDNDDENNYICGIEDFENMNRINSFINKWTQFMVPFQNILYHDSFNDLLKLIINFIKNLIEKRLWNLKVNELGAVKLDKELSLFIDTICSNHYSLRTSFTKLTQIVLILGFDDDDFDINSGDIKEELATSIEWVLNPQERIHCRDLKVDKRI